METKRKRRRKVDHFPARLGWLKNEEIRRNIEDVSVSVHYPEFRTSLHSHDPGLRAVLRFKNSFGASVIRSHFTYGGDEGLFELGIFLFDESGQGGLAVTDLNPDGDVFGYLQPKEVEELLIKIAKLCQGQRVNYDKAVVGDIGDALLSGTAGASLEEK